MVLIEVTGWVIFGLAAAGVVLNFALSRRGADRRASSAARRMVIGCMIAGGVMLAFAYAFAALGASETLIATGRRGGSLWVPAAIFALVAVAGVRAWRKGPAPTS